MKALYFYSQDYECPKDLVLIEDEDDLQDSKIIEKIVRNLLKETVSKNILDELDFQYDDDAALLLNNNAYMLCYCKYGEPFKKITVEVRDLRRQAEIMYLQVVELENIKYLLCDVPADASRYEWDIQHNDSYPHRERMSLKYVLPSGLTEMAFHSIDLPKRVDIENLEILGLQSELRKKTKLSNKIFQNDNLGIFSENEDTFDRYLHLNDVPVDRDVMWLTIN